LQNARAYNQSIYLMVGMPYLLLGAFGFLIYRGFKKKAREDQLAAGDPRPDVQRGEHVLSHESTDFCVRDGQGWSAGGPG
jgi:hypothetical protein